MTKAIELGDVVKSVAQDAELTGNFVQDDLLDLTTGLLGTDVSNIFKNSHNSIVARQGLVNSIGVKKVKKASEVVAKWQNKDIARFKELEREQLRAENHLGFYNVLIEAAAKIKEYDILDESGGSLDLELEQYERSRDYDENIQKRAELETHLEQLKVQKNDLNNRHSQACDVLKSVGETLEIPAVYFHTSTGIRTFLPLNQDSISDKDSLTAIILNEVMSSKSKNVEIGDGVDYPFVCFDFTLGNVKSSEKLEEKLIERLKSSVEGDNLGMYNLRFVPKPLTYVEEPIVTNLTPTRKPKKIKTQEMKFDKYVSKYKIFEAKLGDNKWVSDHLFEVDNVFYDIVNEEGHTTGRFERLVLKLYNSDLYSDWKESADLINHFDNSNDTQYIGKYAEWLIGGYLSNKKVEFNLSGENLGGLISIADIFDRMVRMSEVSEVKEALEDGCKRIEHNQYCQDGGRNSFNHIKYDSMKHVKNWTDFRENLKSAYRKLPYKNPWKESTFNQFCNLYRNYKSYLVEKR